MSHFGLLQTVTLCLILFPLAGCAGSPGRAMIDAHKLSKVVKVKAAENEELILAGRKAGLVFSVDRASFKGSIPCRSGTLEFENTDSQEIVKLNFTRAGPGSTGSPVITMNPGTYIPKGGTCTYIKSQNQYSTRFSELIPFTIAAEGRKPVILAGGEVVYPGTYKFNQVEGPLFSTEFIIPRKDKSKSVEKNRPKLAGRYKNAYN